MKFFRNFYVIVNCSVFNDLWKKTDECLTKYSDYLYLMAQVS